ncbi:MAG: hypothetical protein LBC25_01020 [Holosporales bacterium]|jgi:hypothetical protein|nr:hypothetical protein [Holosporales bacterium]
MNKLNLVKITAVLAVCSFVAESSTADIHLVVVPADSVHCFHCPPKTDLSAAEVHEKLTAAVSETAAALRENAAITQIAENTLALSEIADEVLLQDQRRTASSKSLPNPWVIGVGGVAIGVALTVGVGYCLNKFLNFNIFNELSLNNAGKTGDVDDSEQLDQANLTAQRRPASVVRAPKPKVPAAHPTTSTDHADEDAVIPNSL